MLPRDLGYVSDIVVAIDSIREYIADVDYDDFLDDPRTQDGVIRQITIVGEATKQLTTEFRDAHPDIPWKDLAGLRDVIVHNYRGTDLNLIWNDATVELPKLYAYLKALLPTDGDESQP